MRILYLEDDKKNAELVQVSLEAELFEIVEDCSLDISEGAPPPDLPKALNRRLYSSWHGTLRPILYERSIGPVSTRSRRTSSGSLRTQLRVALN